MKYTFDQFTKAATDAGMMDRFSQQDLDTAKTNPEYGLSMLKLYQDEAGATTPEQKLLAQEAANQLRKTYGTILATDQASAQQGAGSGFNYKNQTVYQDVLDRIVNREPFEYDQKEDPQYSAFRKAYLREADRAREDTLAKVSANSGGTPSSFAVTAAQQAGDYYVGQLNDQLPVLQQNAYQRYLNGLNADINALEVLANDRSFDYSAYLREQEKQAQAAELMAGKGDYSRLAALLGLTDAELAVLMRQNVGAAPKVQQTSPQTKPNLPPLPQEVAFGYGEGNIVVPEQEPVYTYGSILDEYMKYKKAGIGNAKLDAMLKQAVQEGTITQSQANEIRHTRY